MLRFLALSVLLFDVASADSSAPNRAHSDWREYGGAADSSQYSALSQITPANVGKLHVAWRYATGEAHRYSFNPLIVDGQMYVLARDNSLVALDAATGREIWVHKAEPHTTLITHRGVNYWESKDGKDRRLLFASNNALQAVDARTGELIRSFGEHGRVDLRQGLGRDPASLTLVQSTTPGRIFEDLLILGSATNEGYRSAPGDIRAFDVRTGNCVWTFHTIPHPGEYGYQTWPKDAWKSVGGADSWSELSVDTRRGIVYVPTASPKYNFYGADRIGEDLFGDCLLALDARTGKRLWHFQMVHHDIWDYDNATAPKLLTVRHNGAMVDVVAEPSKEGFLWVFDRVTGKPLWPIRERPVPASQMPGEKTWPTQPFPVMPPPFARQTFTARDINPYLDEEERVRFREEVANSRNEGMFTPPEQTNTVEMPGNNGGANWGGAAVDPRNGTLYVVSKDLPCVLKLEPESKATVGHGGSPVDQGRLLYAANCQQCHGANLQGAPPAIPSLLRVGQERSPEQIKSVIQHGQGPMPAFPQLSSAELDAIATYLQRPTAAKAPDTQESSASPDHYVSGFGFLLSKAGLPAISPPWTTLTAYDLNAGTIQWQIPLGTVPELAAKGITNTGGVFQQVGPVVTATGLIFIGTRDGYVRAFDEHTGKILWEAQVGAAIGGVPAVYAVDGKEYLVVCAAEQTDLRPGSRKSTPGAYVAFALP